MPATSGRKLSFGLGVDSCSIATSTAAAAAAAAGREGGRLHQGDFGRILGQSISISRRQAELMARESAENERLGSVYSGVGVTSRGAKLVVPGSQGKSYDKGLRRLLRPHVQEASATRDGEEDEEDEDVGEISPGKPQRTITLAAASATAAAADEEEKEIQAELGRDHLDVLLFKERDTLEQEQQRRDRRRKFPPTRMKIASTAATGESGATDVVATPAASVSVPAVVPALNGSDIVMAGSRPPLKPRPSRTHYRQQQSGAAATRTKNQNNTPAILFYDPVALATEEAVAQAQALAQTQVDVEDADVETERMQRAKARQPVKVALPHTSTAAGAAAAAAAAAMDQNQRPITPPAVQYLDMDSFALSPDKAKRGNS